MNTEQLIAKLKQYPVAVISVLVAVVVAVLIFLRGDRLPQLEGKYNELQTQAKLIDTNLNNAVDLEPNLEKLNQMVAELEARLIDPEAKTDNYRYFLSIAETADVELVDPAMGGAQADPALKVYRSVSFPLSVIGEFHKVLDFIYGLRVGRHLLRVDSVAMQPAVKANGEYQIRAELMVTGMVEKNPNPEPPAKKKR